MSSFRAKPVKHVGSTILTCLSSHRMASATLAKCFLHSAQFWFFYNGNRSGRIALNPKTPSCLSSAFAATTTVSAISRLSWSSMSYYTRVVISQYTLCNCNPEHGPPRSANVDLGDCFFRFILSFLATMQSGPLGSEFNGATEILYYLQSRKG